MSMFNMTKCDNPGCDNTAVPGNLTGWVSIEVDGDCYDGNENYMLIVHGKNKKDNRVYNIPEEADFCCVECFLKATGLKD